MTTTAGFFTGLPDEILRRVAGWVADAEGAAAVLAPVCRRCYHCFVDDAEDAQAAAERRRRDAHPGPGRRFFDWPTIVLGAFVPTHDGRSPLTHSALRVLHLNFGAMRDRSRFRRCSAWRFLCEVPSHHPAGGGGPLWVLRPPEGKGAGIRTADLFHQLLRRTASVPRCVALTLGDPEDARPLAWAEAMRACLAFRVTPARSLSVLHSYI